MNRDIIMEATGTVSMSGTYTKEIIQAYTLWEASMNDLMDWASKNDSSARWAAAEAVRRIPSMLAALRVVMRDLERVSADLDWAAQTLDAGTFDTEERGTGDAK